MDIITMKDMEFWGYVGCLDFEKKDGQRFIISATLGFDGEIKGCHTDDLNDTCDYSKIYERIKEIVTKADCDLIERLAQLIAEGIFDEDAKVSYVKVNVSKPDAPIDGKFASMDVTIERRRNG